jgi:hypothetical protein
MQELPISSAKIKTTDLPFPRERKQQTISIQIEDYVNAFVVNDANEILVLEEKENGRSWASWQMIGKELTSDEDPILAVQQELLIRTGCTCKDWIYLGTFVMDAAHEIGAGHFFCAKTVKKVTKPNTTHSQQLKWVAKREMKQALLDGRIAVLNHAVAVSLAMVMCEDLA